MGSPPNLHGFSTSAASNNLTVVAKYERFYDKARTTTEAPPPRRRI
jgi:hypothetical protein